MGYHYSCAPTPADLPGAVRTPSHQRGSHQAGFADCIDTHQSFRRQLTRLRDLRIIP
jgi:hypothetical protein